MGILPRIPSIAVLVSALALSAASKQWKQSENESLKAWDVKFWDRFLQDQESSIGSESSRSPSSQVPLPPVRPSPPPIPTSAPVPLPSTPLPTVPFPVPTPPPTTTSVPLPIPSPTNPPITTSVPVPLPTSPQPITTSVPVPLPTSPQPITTSVPVPLPSSPQPITTSVPVPLPSTPPPTTTSVPVPLPSPSLSPVQATAVPSFACFINASITCFDESGVPCSQLANEGTTCSTGEDIVAATFTIAPHTCGESRTSQDDSFACEDFGTLPPGTSKVLVSCRDEGGVEFFNGTVALGSAVAVKDITAATLPDSIACVIRDENSGSEIQSVTFDTSGNVDLFLNDRFGMMELISCDVTGQPTLSCISPIIYTYELENVGGVVANVTSFVRSRDGESANLLANIALANPLSPGDAVATTETDEIDLCVGTPTVTMITAGANQVTGAFCESSATYETRAFPTAAPTQSSNIASQPSAAPTQSTNIAPQPSAAPTQSTNIAPQPSAAPNPPTSSPPTEGCLEVKIGCLPPFEGADCNNIPMMVAKCEDPPSQMVMRYNGGDCSGSFNIQPATIFKCVDSQGGPPVDIGTPSYITASELGGKQEEFFSGFVDVGEEFTVIAQSQVSADMNILIYDPTGLNTTDEITTADRLLQSITLHTSCLDFLFLNDRFGAVQLVEFVNERQGRVTSFQNVTMTYTMEIAKNSDLASVALTGLDVTSNLDVKGSVTRDLSQEVVGSSVVPNSTVVVEDSYIVDLSQRKTYTTSAVVLGQSENGVFCSGKDSYQFTAGSPLPPIFPTQSPSSLPTITPFPTPDPLTSPCEVEASISCALSSGRRCNLKSPAGSTCIGSDATFLQFMYSPTSLCKGNNTSTNFLCDDFNRELERPTSVYIRIGKGDQDVWFSEVVSTGRVIDVPVSGESMRIAISTVGADGGPGVILQESRMSIECIQESALTLLSYFGNLQLVGYENLELGLQQVFANVKITYTATNDGELDMQLIGAFGSSPFTGFQEFLDTEGSPLSRDESISFVEEFTLNLDATTGSDFQFTFLAQGQGSISNLGCDDTAAYTLTIQ